MRVLRVLTVVLAAGGVVALGSGSARAEHRPIRQVLRTTPAERARLAERIQADAEVARLWAGLKREADGVLADAPRPLAVVHYEGLVDTDPRRVESEKGLDDMDKVACLVQAYQAGGADPHGAKLAEYVRAWAGAYRPTGNAIHENKLEPVLVGYELVRERMAADERAATERWVAEIARREVEAVEQALKINKANDNWHAKRLKLIAVAGGVLGDARLVDRAAADYRAWVDACFFAADGTSEDLRRRDALSYHLSSVESGLVVAIELARAGRRIEGKSPYEWVAPRGGSLRGGLRYAAPFATGERRREEWRNTTVKLDKDRAAAGLKYYQPGKLFDPQQAREAMELGIYFEPELAKVVGKIVERESATWPTWECVVTAAMR